MAEQETMNDAAVTVNHKSFPDTEEFYTSDGNIVAKKTREGEGTSILSVFYGCVNKLEFSPLCAEALYEFLKKRNDQILKGEDWIYISGLDRIEREHRSVLNSEEDRLRKKLNIHRNFTR